MNALTILEQDLIEVRKRIEECYAFLQRDLPSEKKKRLENIYESLEVSRDRISIALDILKGRAFLIHEHKDQLSVIKPGEKTAKLLAVAEKYGGHVTKYEEQIKL